MQIKVGGVDRSTGYLKAELENVSWRLVADGGEVGQQAFPIPDPAGTQTPVAGQLVEAKVSSTTLLYGFIGPLGRERGESSAGSRLLNSFTVGDENAVLHGMVAYKWVRPSESTRTRFLAFLTDFVPWVTDTTWVTTAVTATMARKTYTTETLFDELYSEIKDLTGNVAFVENHRAHLHPYTDGVSGGLAFTDVAADWDATHLPIFVPKRSKDPLDLRTKIRVVTPSATALVTDGTAVALYDADGIVHEGLVQLDSGSAAVAAAKATQILSDKKRERITYEFEFGPISAADLATIPVGSIIPVTSAVLGLTASDQRIAAMTVRYVHPDRFRGTIETGYPIRQRKTSPRTAPNVCCPPWDGVGSPSAGQDVINELAWTGDGTTVAGVTDFPYIGGSLAVWVAGLNVTGYKTEVDPSTGDFNVSFAPTSGQTVRVNYTAL